MEISQVLDNFVSGFHRCYLSDPIHLDWISENLCNLIGYTKEEQKEIFGDVYTEMIHEEDRDIFIEYAFSLSKEEGKKSCHYRMLHKDGREILVKDEMISHRDENGIMYGYATVTPIYEEDVFSIKVLHNEDSAVFILSDEEFPRIKQLNKKARNLIASESVSQDSVKLVMSNIFFAIPDDDKTYFYEKLRSAGQKPIQLEHSIKCHDRSIKYVSGFLVRRMYRGESIICIVYNSDKTRLSEIEKKYEEKNNRILDFMYDNIYSIDTEKNVFENVKVTNIPISDNDEIVTWHLDEASRRFISEVLSEEDGQRFAECIERIKGREDNDVIPFECNTKEGIPCKCFFVKSSNSKWSLCCNRVEETVSNCCCDKKVRIKTFGYFDIFVNDEPVKFNYSYTKEALALIVDRQGGFITVDEAISYLWENEPASKVTKARYRKVLMRLSETLEAYGIADIIDKDGSNRRIKPELVDCDLYNYLNDREYSSELYDGIYMSNYSWAEFRNWM